MTRKATLDIADAIRCIHTYYNETVRDEHGRYRSWRHCYSAFRECRGVTDDKTIDYLSLHLAFYLASWGMYRGSSFLLQKDYKVHMPVVRIVMETKYDLLLAISAEGLLEEENLKLLDDVSDRIRGAYVRELSSFENVPNNATDTLITKILLGTLGCVPAYDRYYVQAVRKFGISAGIYSMSSVKSAAEYYLTYKEEFEAVRAELSKSGIEYPVMKIMDMCLWQVAYEEARK